SVSNLITQSEYIPRTNQTLYGLGAFFLMLVGLGAIPAAIYGVGYRDVAHAGGRHQVDHVNAMLDPGFNHYLARIASASSRSMYSTCVSWPATIVSRSPHRGQSRLTICFGSPLVFHLKKCALLLLIGF